MALQKQAVQISLSGGIDTKSDEKLVLPANLTELENGVFNKGSTITKRNGYTALSKDVINSVDSLTSGDSITSFEDELFLTSSNKFYSFAPNRNAWLDRGSFKSLLPSLSNIIRNNAEQTTPDVTVHRNIALFAWEDDRGGIRVTVIDLKNNVFLASDIALHATATNPRCINIGSSMFVLYANGSTLSGQKFNLTTLLFEASFNVATDLNFSKLYSIVKRGDESVFAYSMSSSNDIKVGYLLETGLIATTLDSLSNAVTINGDTPTECLEVIANAANDKFYISYFKPSVGLRLFSLNSNLTTDLSARTIDSTSSPIVNVVTQVFDSSGDLNFFYEMNATNTYNRFIKTNKVTIADSTTGSASVVKNSVGLASKAFLDGTVIYMNVVHDSDLQSTFYTMQGTGLLSAKYLQGEAGGVNTKKILPSVIEKESGVWESVNTIKTELVSDNNNVYTKTGLSRVTLDLNTVEINSEELGGNLHVYRGFLNMYDGTNIVEHGFHLYPENITGALGTSGGFMSDGIYNYKVIYSWTDHKGYLHYSATSVILTKTLGAESSIQKITLTVPTLRLTEKTDVKIQVFRTEAGKSTLYYFTKEIDNDPDVNTVDIADTNSDVSLIYNQFLYTNGGILDNIAPPSGSIIGLFKNRVFLVSGEDSKTIYYSKGRSKGLPVEFNETLRITISSADRITAFQEMDGKLFIFEKSKIYVLTGDGPTNTGEQDTFSKPQLVTSDVGCDNTNSIVVTPKGLMFQTTKGIYLLDRSLQTFYIGSPVESFNSKTIKGATLVQDGNQVRFLTDDDITLVYDYYFDKWSTFTNHSGNGSTIWQGAYVYLRDDGEVYQETADKYLDNSRSIVMKLTTAWINLDQLQGFQRVYKTAVLGDYKTSHILVCQIAYDYEEFFNEEHTFDFATAKNLNSFGDGTPYGNGIYGGDSDGVYQFRIEHGKQKCQSFRIRFFDSMPTFTDQSYSISVMQSIVGLKTGLRKLGTSSTI